MKPEPGVKILKAEGKKKISKYLGDFCSVDSKTRRLEIIKELNKDLDAFTGQDKNQIQQLGNWILHFLRELISHLYQHQTITSHKLPDLANFLTDLPFDEQSKNYKSILTSIEQDKTAPLSPERFLFLLQMCTLLNELHYDKSNQFLNEMKQIKVKAGNSTLYSLFIQMTSSIAHGVREEFFEEQKEWLNLILQAWMLAEKKYTFYFIARWVVSLNWLRPVSHKKELLVSLYEASQYTDLQNQAIVLFELFNIQDKSTATGEKLNLLSKLQSIPQAYLSVSQLQNIYYYSGCIKSSIESSFMESVSDFQKSNYFIHKMWEHIRHINKFILSNFTPDEYIKVQSRIEKRIIELIFLINIQSNAYVETLQSNFNKIDDLYHKVEELSLRDSLTGLYNRRYLYNNISELLSLSARQQLPLSFVMMDIDDFKPINDTFGHLAGDFILKEISTILKGYFRKSDFIIRYGGEEFLIILFNSDHLQTEQTVDALRQIIMDKRFVYSTTEMHVTLSIGIASCVFGSPYSTIDLEKMIAEADAAMYKSKTQGKNKITSTFITL